MKTAAVLLFSGLAAATWDRNAGHFNSPQYNNNECSDKQSSGYDWSDLPTGGFSGYDDFNFSGGAGGGGWSCANSFGKRDSITKRSFNSKCVKNKVSRNTAASFDCSSKKEGFSVKDMQVSVEYDTNLEFHYKMPDNSVCKQTASCKKEGTTVENTQCGGATSVEVYLGNHNEGDKEDCEIGFHSIGFDCNPGYGGSTTSSAPVESSTKPAETTSEVPTTTEVPATTTEVPAESTSVVEESSSVPEYSATVPSYGNSSIPVETPTYSVPETTAPVETVPGTTAPVEESSTAASETVPSYETSSAVPETTAPAESYPGYETSAPETSSTASPVESSSVELTTSVVYSTLTSTITSCAAEVTDCPAEQASTVVVTSEIVVGTTVCPVTETAPASAPATTTAAPQTSAPPSGGYTPPDVLPKCMNTWLEINSECKDNTDASCYCGNADFTKNVIDCVAAWTTDAEIQQALQYLIGICANYVPQNPGLITNCPSTVPINPTTSAESSAAPSSEAPASSAAPSEYIPSGPAPTTSAAAITTPAPEQPVTTITYETTMTIPYTTMSASSIMSSYSVSTVKTSLTVPQIVFTTQPAGPEQSGASTTSEEIVLVPGTPAPVLASTTAAPYPIPGVPTTLGTGVVPSGSATYSPPSEFTGAASPLAVGVTPALFGAVLAFLAL